MLCLILFNSFLYFEGMIANKIYMCDKRLKRCLFSGISNIINEKNNVAWKNTLLNE